VHFVTSTSDKQKKRQDKEVMRQRSGQRKKALEMVSYVANAMDSPRTGSPAGMALPEMLREHLVNALKPALFADA
jgi:glycerol-3-phosphate cytidylyltransferase-like family protein